MDKEDKERIEEEPKKTTKERGLEIPEEKEVKQEELLKIKKPKAVVFKIKKDSIFLRDNKGNGISIPLESKHKNVKVGDIIEF